MLILVPDLVQLKQLFPGAVEADFQLDDLVQCWLGGIVCNDGGSSVSRLHCYSAKIGVEGLILAISFVTILLSCRSQLFILSPQV